MAEANNTSPVAATGGCLCGAVRYEVRETLRGVVNCHCGQCRRIHGHYAAYSSATRDHLVVTRDRGLKWYDSSETARRAFCAECGSTLFWEPRQHDYTAIAAGSLDQPTGLETVGHIFCADIADYYSIGDGLRTWPGSMQHG